MPGKAGSRSPAGSRRRKPHLGGSQSLPSLALGASPLAQPQRLCTVQVGKRRLVREAVGGGSVRLISSDRLSFAAFERGLEWERPHVVARPPPERLPPLVDVMRLAMQELGLQLPQRGEPREVQHRSLLHGATEPYMGGPRLPRRGRQHGSLVRSPPLPPQPEEALPPEEPSPLAEQALTEGWSRRGTEEATANAATAAEAAMAGAAATEAAGETAHQLDDDLPFPWREEDLHMAFSRFDSDRDGELHTSELPALLRYIGARPLPGDAERIVKEQTQYSTLSWEEFLDFLHRFRQVDVARLREQFAAADTDNSGSLDFAEFHALLQELGYAPTTQSTLEAFESLDKDRSKNVSFWEFERLRDYLRATEGFIKADVAELRLLHERSALSKEGPQEVAEESWRITMYLGYSAPHKLLQRITKEVDADGSCCLSFHELLKVVRLVRDVEREDMIKILTQHGTDPKRLPCEDLGIALADLGYFVSEDAVNEILEALGECETEESLTLEELASFLRGYRRVEGFTEAELAELKEAFAKEGRGEHGQLRTLEVGKVLRWFGFARTVQQVQRLVEEIDLDGSGVLEFVEFVKLMRRLHQEEAERRHHIFFDLATRSTARVLEVPTTKLAQAAALLQDAEPDDGLVEEAIRALLIDLGKQPSGGAGVQDGKTVFVGKPGFEAFFRHYRRLAVEEVRASAGYSPSEKAWLREVFDEYDKDRSGTIERIELMKLIAEYFPDATKSKAGQKDIQRSLEEVDADANGHLTFAEFLMLMRKCDDARDTRDIELEQEVVQECRFQPEEVDGFRQIFATHADWKGELDVQTLAGILGSVVDLSEEELENLSTVVMEVHPEGLEVVRFPHFLRLISRLTQENYGRLNEQTARVVRRQQRSRVA